MSRAQLRLLGGFQLLDAKGASVAVSAKKAAALLAYVALSPQQPTSRDKLTALLWEESAEAQARASLRQALLVLRKAVPAGVIEADAQRVWIDSNRLQVDVIEFEVGLEPALSDDLQAAVAWYQGDLLDGFYPRAPAFEAWSALERQRLRERAVRALRTLLSTQREAGRTEAAVATAVRLLSLDPLQEAVHRQLIELYLKAGRRGAASRQYSVCRDLLARELGVPPSPETECTFARLRAAAEPSLPPSEPATAEPASSPELRHVSLLYIGMTLSEAMTHSEAAHHCLVRAIASAEAAVTAAGGTVIRSLPDSLLAVFGVPRARSRDAALAVRAAADVRRRISQLASELDAGLAVHVGAATGQVMVSRGPAGQGWNVVGAPVSLAAGLQARAAAGEIVVSDAVRAATVAEADYEPAAGKAAFRLLRVREGLDKAHEQAFVGRRTELRLLAGALDACLHEGRGHSLLVRGEAGIGKTRLLTEVAWTAEEMGFRTHCGLIQDFGVGAPERAISALILGLLGLEPNATPTVRREAVAAAIHGVWAADNDELHLLELLEVPLPAELRPISAAMESSTHARGQRAALGRFVRASSAEQPRLLAVEDIHWSDETTLDHLLSLMAAVAECPTVLILTSRFEGEPLEAAWRRHRVGAPFSTIDLAPLRGDEAQALAAQYPEVSPGIADEAVRRAEGNPLYLDQLLRVAGAHRDRVPGAVHSIVLARLDALEPADRDALRAASALGQHFSLEALRELLDAPSYACDALLDVALIRPHDGEYLFSHALIRDAVYASLLEEPRAELHRRAAAWFAGTDPTLHAEHLDRAGASAAAAAYLSAARREAAAYRYSQALSLANRALELAAGEPIEYELTCLVGRLQRLLGQVQQSLDAYRQAEQLAAHDLDRCRALLGTVEALRMLDRPADVLLALDEAEAAAGTHEAPLERSRIHYHRGNAYFPLGRIDGCLHEHQRALELARRGQSPVDEAQARSGLADAYYLRGHMLTAHDHYQACIDLCRAHGLGFLEVNNIHSVGITRFYQCQLDEARHLCHEAVSRSQRVGNRRAEMVAWSNLGEIELFSADWAELREVSQRALALSEPLGATRFSCFVRGYDGFAHAMLGERVVGARRLHQAYLGCAPDGDAFAGPSLLALVALVDRERRGWALRHGLELLQRGDCVSHNYLLYYPVAIGLAAAEHDWDAVRRHVEALEQYTAAERLPWTDYFVDWAAALQAGTAQEPSWLERERATGLRFASVLARLSD